MVNIINDIFDNSMFSDIIFVDENPGIFKSVSIEKINGKIERCEKEISYELDIKPISNFTSDEIYESIVFNYLKALNFKSECDEVKYFNRNILKRLFKKQKYTNILKHIKGYDWIITTDKVINELKKSPNFEDLESKSKIKLVGKINNTLIYNNPFTVDQINDKSVTYLGKKNNITPIFLNNYSKSLEYKFIINERTKRMIIS